MNRYLLLLALMIYNLCTYGQIRIMGKSGIHFPMSDVHIVLSNNFVRTTHPYTPWYIAIPVNESFIVYGNESIISIIETGSQSVIGEYQGFLYRDSVDKSAFHIKELEIRVIKNDTVSLNWMPVLKLRSYTEKDAVYVDGRPGHPLGYSLTQNLHDGDSATVEFRGVDKSVLLTMHLHKQKGDTQPFITHMQQEDLINIETMDGYEDWPGQGLNLTHSIVKEHSNVALSFRKVPNDVLEYRVHGGQYKNKAWLQTNGIIIITDIRQGEKYKLEVRFKKHPAQYSVYNFALPPLWYDTRWFKILIIFLLLIILIFITLRIRIVRSRRKAERYRLEVKALYAQMNPHFLFNALSSIQGLMNDAQIEKANHYLNGFASLLRGTILMGNKDTIPLSAELKNLNNYIQLEKLRFEFQYIYQHDETLNEVEVPPLLAQPIIENAVKHGISAKREKGALILSVSREQADVLISVTDNGNGFDPSMNTNGYGIKLTEERIAVFNRIYKTRTISLEVRSSASGTIATFRFKNWLNYD